MTADRASSSLHRVAHEISLSVAVARTLPGGFDFASFRFQSLDGDRFAVTWRRRP